MNFISNLAQHPVSVLVVVALAGLLVRFGLPFCQRRGKVGQATEFSSWTEYLMCFSVEFFLPMVSPTSVMEFLPSNSPRHLVMPWKTGFHSTFRMCSEDFSIWCWVTAFLSEVRYSINPYQGKSFSLRVFWGWASFCPMFSPVN